jgi:enolase
MESIEKADFKPGEEVTLGTTARRVLLSGSATRRRGKPAIKGAGQISRPCPRLSIISIEDGLAEDDWGWKFLTDLIGKTQLVGDHRHVTNTAAARRHSHGSCQSIPVKVNQIGSLTETPTPSSRAQGRLHGGDVAPLGRNGRSTIADLAVATNCGQIGTGSLSRSDRMASTTSLSDRGRTRQTGHPLS